MDAPSTASYKRTHLVAAIDRLANQVRPLRSLPMIRPGVSGIRSGRCNPPHRTFRHIAGNRREAVEPLTADAVHKRVDKAGEPAAGPAGRSRTRPST
jgi:hypothetical protein